MLGVSRIMRFLVTVSVVVISALLAGCAQPMQPDRVTIRAVHATGDTFFTPSPQPIWRFVITNNSQSEVCWQSGVETRGDTNYGRACLYITWPQGILPPNQRIETNMIVPAKSGIGWRAFIDFRTLTPQESDKIKAEMKEFKGPSEYEWCPHDNKWKSYKDEWHY